MDQGQMARYIQAPYSFIESAGKDLWIVEYKWFDGGWTLRDSFIKWFYENLAYRDRIFYNVEDFNAMNPVSFFRSMRLFVGFHEDRVVGGYWISSYNALNKSGTFNCGATIEQAKNVQQTMRFVKQGLEYLLFQKDIRTLYGDTSVNNLPVLALARWLGFERLGIVPRAHFNADTGEFCDAIIMYINHNLFKRG